MSGRSKETHAIQLFPFLAVLVCTMGSLIFLLLLTTRQIRQRAIALAEFERAQRRLAAQAAAAVPLPDPPAPEPEPEAPKPPPILVLPPQPPRKSKPIKLPDQSHLIALEERQREITDLTTKWRLRTQKLKDERDRRRKLIAQRKIIAADAGERTDAMKSELARLETQLGQMTGEATAASQLSAADAELQTVEQQIDEMKKKLRAAQLAEANAENEKFQVVPFDPQTGTTRRPILIECTEIGIRFLPENITISAADLNGFTNRVNPLAAGTGALINYWANWNSKQKNPRSQPEPYPLLLVRPNGVVAYYVALRMLEPIHTTRGYELIDETTSLQLPEVDPGAKAACQAAVNRLMTEREKIYRSAVSSGGGEAVFGGTPRRGGGSGPGMVSRGFGGAQGSNGPQGAGGSQGNGDLPGPSSGNSGASESGGFTMDALNSNEGNHSGRSWERIENFEGRPRRKGTDSSLDEIQSRLAQVGGESGSTGSTGSGGDGTSARGSTYTGSTGAGAGSVNGSSAGSAGSSNGSSAGGAGSSNGSGAGGAASSNGSTGGGAGGPNGSSGNGAGSSFGSGTGAAGSTNGSNAGGFASESSSAQNQGSGVDGQNSPQGTANGTSGGMTRRPANGSKSNASFSNNQYSANGEYQPGMPIGKRLGSKSSPSNGSSSGSSGGSGDEADDEGEDDPSSNGQSGSSSSQRGSSSNRSLFSVRNGGSQRPPIIPSNTTSKPRKPKVSKEDADKPIEPEMLAGRHWGYSEAGSGIGFERDVRVSISPDKLLIGEKYEIPIVDGETKQQRFELFVTMLEKQAREWGHPPQGFFWTPRLKFIVKPEASAQYEQMNTMMTRAGISTTHEFAKTTDTIEYGRDPISTKKPVAKSNSKTYSGGVR